MFAPVVSRLQLNAALRPEVPVGSATFGIAPRCFHKAEATLIRGSIRSRVIIFCRKC
jgi:hypothetical protein